MALIDATLDEALAIYAQPKQRGRAAAAPPLKELGADPATLSLKDGKVVGSATTDARRVISEQAAQMTTEMMEAVTDPEEGTAPAAAIEGYRVAGKTGTAQRVGAECGCYDGTFTVSFAGFAPADDPRFLVYVVVQDPKNGGGGGSVGGPAFRKIMTHLLQKYAVPPTGSQAPRPRVEW